MADVIIRPVTAQPQFSIGGPALASQVARAIEAADAADAAATEIRAFSGGLPGGDAVIDAAVQVAGMTVTVTGSLRTIGQDDPVPFAASTTLDMPATTTVVDAAHTIAYVNGYAAWPFLTAKLAHANITNLVVKDASTSAVLVRDIDYVADTRFGAIGRKTAGASRNVLVSYTASQERYDLLCLDPIQYLSLNAAKGEAAIRDAAERLPNAGSKVANEDIPIRMPLYSARVTASSVELVKVWNLRDGIAREFEAQYLADQRRNRAAIRPLLDALAAGANTIWSAMGDSITAIQSDVPSSTVPNGQYRDRATASGTTNTYLREGIIGTALIDAVPHAYDNGDAAGPNHTRFGRTWDLVTAADERFAGSVSYRNYSIAGTSSDDAPLGMTNPTRLAAWATDGSDAGIIATAMNDMDQGSTLFFNRIRKMIDAKYAGGAKGVIVWGCTRPQASAATVENWLRMNRILRVACETPGTAGRTAAFIDLSMIYYGDGAGTMGISPADLCMANGFNHPGIRQHAIEGWFGRKVVFG